MSHTLDIQNAIALLSAEGYEVKAPPKPERDWEIVKCIDCGGNIHDHYSTERAKLCGVPSCETQGCKIHSVKRLSDSEVFSVGDEVTDGKITKISISDSWGGGLRLDHNTGSVAINTAQKPKFTPKSGEFVTLEECERRMRDAFWAARERTVVEIPSPMPPLKHWSFEDYKQSIKK